MKVTNETKHVARLKDDVANLIEYYMELDEVGYEKFLTMFQDQLQDLMKYHQAQLDKAKNLQERLGGHRSVDLSSLNFDHFNDKHGPDRIKLDNIIMGSKASDTIKFDLGLDEIPHSDYYWDTDRNK